jgi:hypothetical protein
MVRPFDSTQGEQAHHRQAHFDGSTALTAGNAQCKQGGFAVFDCNKNPDGPPTTTFEGRLSGLNKYYVAVPAAKQKKTPNGLKAGE